MLFLGYSTPWITETMETKSADTEILLYSDITLLNVWATILLDYINEWIAQENIVIIITGSAKPKGFVQYIGNGKYSNHAWSKEGEEKPSSLNQEPLISIKAPPLWERKYGMHISEPLI